MQFLIVYKRTNYTGACSWDHTLNAYQEHRPGMLPEGVILNHLCPLLSLLR